MLCDRTRLSTQAMSLKVGMPLDVSFSAGWYGMRLAPRSLVAKEKRKWVEDDTTDFDVFVCFDSWDYPNEACHGCEVSSGWDASWCHVQSGTVRDWSPFQKRRGSVSSSK